VSDRIALTLRTRPAGAVDASSLALHDWTDRPGAEIAKLSVRVTGAGSVALGDLFSIAGERAPRIRLTGDFSAFEGLGAELAGGDITIEGDVGPRVGTRMRAGQIRVTGSAGWGAGLEMSGGVLEIGRDAGPRAGGAALGAKRGMTGGELIIRGNAGAEAGAAMRRGLVVVGGDAEEGAGRTTIAGTVVVFGATGPNPGQWSKRGTVVALGPVTPPATYRFACTYRPQYLGVLLRHLGTDRRLPVTAEHLTGFYKRYSGDLAELGAGEILAWTRT
jgi:formylmethanofuran dehydrogenase subunit C